MSSACRREIAEIEAQIRAGHPDGRRIMPGTLGLVGEMRVIHKELTEVNV